MDDDRKNNAAGSGDGGDGPNGRANPNGARRVPGAAFYTPAARREIGELLQRIGRQLAGVGATIERTGELLPAVGDDSAADAVAAIKVELRHTRDLIIHLEINLPGGR